MKVEGIISHFQSGQVNLLLLWPRYSKGYDHGFDNFLDFSAIAHIFKEGSWNLWKNLAQDHPWDEEFKEAEDMFGF